MASLLAAATAPAAPEELAGEQAVMTEYALVMRSTPSTFVARRTAVPGKVFTMKAAAAALVAVLSIGGVAAAASGLLPDQASPVADQAPATTDAGEAAHGPGKAAAANLGGSANAGSTAEEAAGESAVGPDARGAARAGLCRAWQAGQGADQGQRAESVAFQALVEAAGGANKVAAYCEDVAPGRSTDARGQRPASRPSVSAPSTSVSPPSSGPPADPGPPASTGPGGHGQGGPPTTSG